MTNAKRSRLLHGPRPRRRLLRAVVGVLLLGLVVALLGAWYVDHRLVDRLGRVDGAFAGLTDRPHDTDALTFLLVLEDRGTPRSGSWLPGHGAVAAVQLVQVAADRRTVRAVALPPASSFPDGSSVADAADTGRPADLVREVEAVSGERVDHLTVVDLGYVRSRAEDEGGVTLTTGPVTPAEVVDRFRGTDARAVQGQLDVLDPLMQGTLHQAFRRHPWELWSALEDVAGSSAVEDGWSAVSMAATVVSLRDLRSGRIGYVLAPESCGAGGCTLRAATDGAAWTG
jgi:hypothetical protein